jgi:flagellar motor switch protein FliM
MCYIVPLSQKTLIVELDNELIFPIIELLMGGTGTAQTAGRDLSEIESEIMQMVVSLMARQAETVWKIPDLALEPGSRMKPALMHQSFALTEKATVLKFGVEIAGSSGTFKLVFPTEFLNVLMARIKLDQPVKKTRIWSFPAPPLRERILDCDFDICSELPGLKVAVRDLIALQPGSVLKLRAPVRNPGMLTVGGREFFEAIPVRNGQLRAAQLGERIGAAEWKRS